MVSLVDFKGMEIDALASYAKELGLDSVGPKSVVLDRIQRHLKIQGKLSSTQKPKKRSKKKKRTEIKPVNDEEVDEPVDGPVTNDVVIVPETLAVKGHFQEFADVFAKFNELSQRKAEKDEDEQRLVEDYDEEEEMLPDLEQIRQSKKKLKKLNRLSVAQLKNLVKKPEVVEWVDVTSSDPLLLVQLKSCRNTVPVPVHWSQKRKYLQGKRGVEKPPFELPEYIKATGIMQLRQSSEAPRSLQGKARLRNNPKLGKLDIDYQKLHDAFFRYQTKPMFSSHGDIYFEGKEFETNLRMRKPGVVSEELKIALNIPPLAPPPWLINMQRYGPPPSYPQLKVPGLNAPIPEGAQWGFHPGGWGKPPCDENNRPLYGDVFGSHTPAVSMEFVAPIEAELWGELDEEEEEEEEEEDEEEDEDEEAAGEEESVSGLETPSGYASSVPSGIVTPDHIELRKQPSQPKRSEEKSDKQLYTVLSQQETKTGKDFMGSSHTYSIPGRTDKLGLAPKKVDVAFNPDELENMDSETLKRKFNAEIETSTAHVPKENFSDMVDEHIQKQASKRTKKDSGSGKKHKDFKF
ncbi:hypothetical protein BC833DRAFT_584504 [Globomyces pollinis-pini]|nr:hypothetical protein BC833DRAFT_584504 [Globomyces pollinis-pini]